MTLFQEGCQQAARHQTDEGRGRGAEKESRENDFAERVWADDRLAAMLAELQKCKEQALQSDSGFKKAAWVAVTAALGKRYPSLMGQVVIDVVVTASPRQFMYQQKMRTLYHKSGLKQHQHQCTTIAVLASGCSGSIAAQRARTWRSHGAKRVASA